MNNCIFPSYVNIFSSFLGWLTPLGTMPPSDAVELSKVLKDQAARDRAQADTWGGEGALGYNKVRQMCFNQH